MEVEPNEDETVTDVVYNVYADLSDKVVDEKTNEIVLDYTNKYVDTDKLSVTFTPAQIETVYQQQKNAKVVVKDKYVSTKLPVSLLKSNDRVTFVTVPKFDQEGALCPVIDFTIVTADGQKITNFEEIPITLTFLINPILVKDWNDVKVVYLDENGQMKEFLTPTSVDKVNGYVTVDVTHFSTYGVFEVASADTETPDNTEEGTKDDAPSKNDSGKKLPATATEDYNLLTSGILLIVVSGVIFFVLNRRRVNNI